MSKPPEIVADELIETFAETIPGIEYGILLERNWVVAKACAIIHCNGIIDALKDINPGYEKNTYWHPIDYWKQVLTIIKGK